MYENLQAIRDTAYERWQSDNNMSEQEFWNGLNTSERIAVFCGNLNYQVCNGGFVQWHENEEATEEVLDFLIQLCGSMDTKNGTIVQALLQEFRESQVTFVESEGDDGDHTIFHTASDVLSSRFYDINDSWLREIEALVSDPPGALVSEAPEAGDIALALALSKLSELEEEINTCFPRLTIAPARDRLLVLLQEVRLPLQKAVIP